VAIVIIGVLAVVSVGLMRRSSSEIDAVSAKRQYDSGVSCADGARQLLLSQFRTFGTPPSELVLDQTVGDRRYTSGHYDNFAVKAVVPSTAAQAGSLGVSDITNRTSKARLGGQVYRMTVVCSNANPAATDRQSEVEFLVRFGL
jgi:hypothetical protein